VLDFCFAQKGEPFRVIQHQDDSPTDQSISVNYSNDKMDANLSIAPQGILFESEIYPSKELKYENGTLTIDGVHDPFGLIFYFLTNYSEYFNQDRDQHDRFKSVNHPLVKLGLNTTPVVDLLIKQIWEQIGLDYSKVQKGFEIVPTFDIDIAWAYKERPFLRAIGAAFKGGSILERIQVMSGAKKDPYDTFEEIQRIADDFEKTRGFVLLGDYGPYDKNIPWNNSNYQLLINQLSKNLELGIHPSYKSYGDQHQIKIEKSRLEQIVDRKIVASRQHFLRLKIPNTYHDLIDVGLNHDHSMGFADNIGFRSGTSFSYPFFNLINNHSTTFMIHPFVYMDSAFKDYLKLDVRQSMDKMNQIMQQVKEVGGQFSFIWHNSSIHDQGEWKGWKILLNQTLAAGYEK
jgi:hypothetical protein